MSENLGEKMRNPTTTVSGQIARNRTSTKRKVTTPMIPRPTLQSLPNHEANLYEAVARYIEYGGGKAIIIGGVEVQQWPNDPREKYRVAISFLGTPPQYAKPDSK
jgi:hypothetical protein